MSENKPPENKPELTPEEAKDWIRNIVLAGMVFLFWIALVVKLYLAVKSNDMNAIDSVITFLAGFVSAVLLYLGIKLGRENGSNTVKSIEKS